MEKLHLIIYVIAFIYGLYLKKLKNTKRYVIALLFLGISIYWLKNYMYIFPITVISIVIMGNVLSKSEDFAAFKKDLFKCFIAIIFLIVLDRSVFTRIYDTARVISLKDEIKINQELMYNGVIKTVNNEKLKIYLVTVNEDGNPRKQIKVEEKLKKRDDTIVIYINYNKDKELMSVDRYLTIDYILADYGLLQKNIYGLLNEVKIKGNVDKIRECIAEAINNAHYFGQSESNSNKGINIAVVLQILIFICVSIFGILGEFDETISLILLGVGMLFVLVCFFTARLGFIALTILSAILLGLTMLLLSKGALLGGALLLCQTLLVISLTYMGEMHIRPNPPDEPIVDDYDDYYDEEPGVHWVDEYYRDDGTHVDGHWRTDPDGDVTNNFSYDGY